MGISLAAPIPLAQVLFSPVQRELLALLYGQPERQFLGSQLIAQLGRGTGAVHRQLQQFAASGLVTTSRRANQKYYQADPRSPIFEELRGIVLKTVGLVGPLREALLPISGGIVAAFVYGSIARGAERSGSDIDLMVLTRGPETVTYAQLFEAVGSAEGQLGRKVNPVIMTAEEWGRKRMIEESFVARVAEGARMMILGNRDDVA